MKKQACIHRVCTWKNPGGKRGAGAGRGTSPKTPKTPDTPGTGRGRGRPKREDPATPTLTSTPAAAEPTSEAVPAVVFEDAAVSAVKKRGRRSISVISPAAVKEVLVMALFLLDFLKWENGRFEICVSQSVAAANSTCESQLRTDSFT